MIILGVDPGLANFGYALIDAAVDGESWPTRVVDLGVVRTHKTSRVSVADDEAWRLSEIVDKILDERDTWVEARCEPAMMAMERFERLPHARSARQINLCRGAMVALARQWKIPIEQPGPMKIKEGVTQNKKASKRQVIIALRRLFGSRQTSKRLRDKGIADSWHEHAFDALGAALVSVPGDSGSLFRGI